MPNRSSRIEVAQLLERTKKYLSERVNTKFWKRDPDTKDEINDVDDDIDLTIDTVELSLSGDGNEEALDELMTLR
jgi:hypothetical protein